MLDLTEIIIWTKAAVFWGAVSGMLLASVQLSLVPRARRR